MSLYLAGMGWVTPLGSGIGHVWERLLKGEAANPTPIADPVSDKQYIAFRVPPEGLQRLPPHPRLRRASAISKFAAAAGLEALDHAGLTAEDRKDAKIALLFGVANGGVIYTKRFYNDIIVSGAGAASPLLFPETVFNAAASHLAAILGITGSSYTLVGDGAVGFLAMKMAEDLMADSDLDFCLVVGAEEADWLLCDAYRRWRLIRSAPPIEPFRSPPKGTILSEGAGAILVGRSGAVQLDTTVVGGNFSGRRAAAARLSELLERMPLANCGLAVTSANGTFIDAAEAEAIHRFFRKAVIGTVKPALGESVGASSLWQMIVAAEALRTRQLPPYACRAESLGVEIGPVSLDTCDRAVVIGCGLNQQTAALRLSVAPVGSADRDQQNAG